MSESVILQTPILIVLYSIALALTLFEKLTGKGAFLPWAAAILVAGTSAYSVLLGAGLRETAAVVVLFVIISLIRPKGEKQ